MRDAISPVGVSSRRASTVETQWNADTCFQLSPQLRVLSHPDLGVVTALGRAYQQWDAGGSVAGLLDLLRVQRSAGQLARMPPDGLSGAHVLQALQSLISRELVVPVGTDHVGVGDGNEPRLNLTQVQQVLQREANRCWPGRVRIGTGTHLLSHDATRAWQQALAEGALWLPLSRWDGQLLLGPVLGAAPGACLECLRQRLWQNHPVERYLQGTGATVSELWPDTVPGGGGESSSQVQWAKTQVAALLDEALADPAGLRALVSLDETTRLAVRHVVVRRPQCAHCGDAEMLRRRMRNPPSFDNAARVRSRDGGLRTLTPEATLGRLEHHVSSITGLVSSLGALDFKSNRHHSVFAACHFVTPAVAEIPPRDPFHQVSAGKGCSPAQAKTSALCEALERQCARAQGDEEVVRGSFEALSPAAVDPRSILLFSELQYRAGTPERLRSQATVRSQDVPAPWNPTTALDWTPLWALGGGQRRLIPTAYLLAGWSRPPSERVCSWDSNGCAAGNCLEEAGLQGLLELVERDAIAIWWYNRIPRPRLPLDTGLSAQCNRLLGAHHAAGREVWALDLTHDIGIPVVAVLAFDSKSGGFTAGFGCHPVGLIATERAILELEQVMDNRAGAAALWLLDEVQDPRYLWPAIDARPVSAPIMSPTGGDGSELSETWWRCVERVRARGLEPLLFDYSRPDVALKTVKVIVPGLRHFWPRYAPGRLYDVPVQLGWSRESLSEQSLNPLPLLM